MEQTLTKSVETLIKKIDPSYRKHLKEAYLNVAQDLLWMMHGGQSNAPQSATEQKVTPKHVLDQIDTLQSAIKTHHQALNSQKDPRTLATGALSLQGAMTRLKGMIQKLHAKPTAIAIPAAPVPKPFTDPQLKQINKSLNSMQLKIDDLQNKLVLLLKSQGLL